ncbi:MAG: hypothetical protein E7244_21120 [Enterocloster citroniae]|nr:hypothetical protein [Enterocloster citroniae]
MEHFFNKRKKILFEACKQRSIRNLMEAAKIAKFLTEIKKKDKQGICRNGKNLLKDEGSQKAGKRVKPFTA